MMSLPLQGRVAVKKMQSWSSSEARLYPTRMNNSEMKPLALPLNKAAVEISFDDHTSE
jgi:hypothetical protein